MGNLPTHMRAIEIAEFGGPEVLTLCERPVPTPNMGDVLIAVSAAGVNRPDIVQRKGLYPPPPGASDIPGLEAAGTIAAVGAGVDAGLVGRRVAALVTGGGYAEFCTANAGHCLALPDAMTFEAAAALPETLFTVWHNVFERGYARDGETLLVHGGTSGIGSMAIKLGKLFGMTVIATCGTDEKCAAAKSLGADHAINYKTEMFEDAARTLTDGKGVEIILDMVGGSYLPRNMRALADDGRCVTIAVQGGLKAEISVVELMTRRLTLTGSTLRPRSLEFKALLVQEIAAYVWPMVEDGTLSATLDRTFPLADAAAAHAYMESGDHVGKIVLTV
jgi:NADPH:quinone reductase